MRRGRGPSPFYGGSRHDTGVSSQQDIPVRPGSAQCGLCLSFQSFFCENPMLLQLVANHPEALVPILRNTPMWVWGLLAALLALGFSQLRDRTASVARVSLLPLAMTIFSVSGTFSALGGTPHGAISILAWLAAAVLAFALTLLARGRNAAHFDPARRLYRLPGSTVPLWLIVGIFLVKYVVGVDLAMAPQLVRDAPYVLTIAALYGAFTGVFVGRASRLWRLSLRPAAAATASA